MLRQMAELGTRFPTENPRFPDLRGITIRDIRSYVLCYDLRVGERVNVRVWRAGREVELAVELQPGS